MSLKRKGHDDGGDPGAALFGLKKLRQDSDDLLPEFPGHGGPIAVAEVCPVEIPSDTPVDSTPVSLFVTEPDADERALVLYRPMDLPDRPRHRQMTGSFPRHYRDFQVCDAVEKFSPSKSFKHDFALSNGKTVGNNSLAVIPYVARAGFHDGGRVIIEDITDQVRQDEEEPARDQGMAVEDEATPMLTDEDMAEAPMEDEVPSSQQQGYIVQQPYEVPSWQRFDPNLSRAMWSG